MNEIHIRSEEQHVLAARAHRSAADQDELGNQEAAAYYANSAASYSDRAYQLALEGAAEWGEAALSKTSRAAFEGSFSGKHRCAAELHDSAVFAHNMVRRSVGGKYSLSALEHSASAHLQTRLLAPNWSSFVEHTEIAELARQMWQARGCPEGSPQQDWFDAASQVRSRVNVVPK